MPSENAEHPQSHLCPPYVATLPRTTSMRGTMKSCCEEEKEVGPFGTSFEALRKSEWRESKEKEADFTPHTSKELVSSGQFVRWPAPTHNKGLGQVARVD
jgi:hypothetical protein